MCVSLNQVCSGKCVLGLDLTPGSNQAWSIGFDDIAGLATGDHQIIAVGALGPDEGLLIQIMASSMTATVRAINNMRCVIHG
jgi:hypothetical protein